MAVDAKQYPQLARLEEVQAQEAAILDFLDWCEAQGMELGMWIASGRYMRPVGISREQLLAGHLGVDLKVLENERRALLASFTAAHPAKPEQSAT